MSDRTVHAVTANGLVVVRYDRAGKWYLEGGPKRLHLRIVEAVAFASYPESVWHEGMPGGTYFDAQVRRGKAPSPFLSTAQEESA